MQLAVMNEDDLIVRNLSELTAKVQVVSTIITLGDHSNEKTCTIAGLNPKTDRSHQAPAFLHQIRDFYREQGVPLFLN